MKLPRVNKDRGYYMRIFRATYGFSHQQAAEWLGVTPSFWSLLEHGHRHASPKVAVKLAAVTKAPIELFLGIEVTR